MIKDTEHELLTKFLKIKSPSIQGTESKDAFEFIIDCYKWLYKMGIIQKHGVEYVTFLLVNDAK